MDHSQTHDVPFVGKPISSSNSTDNLVDTTDETNTGETIDHESLQEASIESNADVDEDNQINDSFEDVTLANLQQQYQQKRETVTRAVGTRGVRTRGGVRTSGGVKRTRGKAQATEGRGRGRGRGRGQGRGRGRGQNCTAQNPDETWKLVSKETVEEQNVPPVFLDHAQLNIQMQSTTPLDFFELYFTEDVVRLLVIKTNRYAVNFFAENPEASETSYTGSWQDVDEVEMRIFIGLIFLMGIIYKPSIPMYWSTEELYHTPIFQKAMSRNQFQLILKFFHCNDNNNPQYDANDENRDRLYKVRPLIDLLRARCKTVYTPDQNVSVDESLVILKGRLRFKQLIKKRSEHALG